MFRTRAACSVCSNRGGRSAAGEFHISRGDRVAPVQCGQVTSSPGCGTDVAAERFRVGLGRLGPLRAAAWCWMRLERAGGGVLQVGTSGVAGGASSQAWPGRSSGRAGRPGRRRALSRPSGVRDPGAGRPGDRPGSCPTTPGDQDAPAADAEGGALVDLGLAVARPHARPWPSSAGCRSAASSRIGREQGVIGSSPQPVDVGALPLGGDLVAVRDRLGEVLGDVPDAAVGLRVPASTPLASTCVPNRTTCSGSASGSASTSVHGVGPGRQRLPGGAGPRSRRPRRPRAAAGRVVDAVRRWMATTPGGTWRRQPAGRGRGIVPRIAKCACGASRVGVRRAEVLDVPALRAAQVLPQPVQQPGEVHGVPGGPAVVVGGGVDGRPSVWTRPYESRVRVRNIEGRIAVPVPARRRSVPMVRVSTVSRGRSAASCRRWVDRPAACRAVVVLVVGVVCAGAGGRAALGGDDVFDFVDAASRSATWSHWAVGRLRRGRIRGARGAGSVTSVPLWPASGRGRVRRRGASLRGSAAAAASAPLGAARALGFLGGAAGQVDDFGLSGVEVGAAHRDGRMQTP